MSGIKTDVTALKTYLETITASSVIIIEAVKQADSRNQIEVAQVIQHTEKIVAAIKAGSPLLGEKENQSKELARIFIVDTKSFLSDPYNSTKILKFKDSYIKLLTFFKEACAVKIKEYTEQKCYLLEITNKS